MKRYLPVFLFLIGVVVVAVAFFLVKGRRQEPVVEEQETALRDVPLNKRPVTSLTPSSDGHWLKLKIDKIVIDAASLDYELLYKLPDGRTQGVPGTIQLEGQKEIERDLLLGSESSGKFRYDEGVENGTLTLRFRNEKGKLVAKFSTDFHLQSNTDKLTSFDGNFKYTLPKASKAFFITMETFGIPGEFGRGVAVGPYGIFGSEAVPAPGTAEMNSEIVYYWDASSWNKLENNESSDIGIFIGVSQ
jgi:hypothetical protein